MNYLHWRCHLSFLDVSPQIIPAKKAWETRLNFPAVSSGWREECGTILEEPESGRDTIHTYPTEIRTSGTISHRWNCLLGISCYRGGSRIFFRRGCTRLLLYFNTNKPHSFFFWRIPVVLDNRRSSRGGGCAPPAPSPWIRPCVKIYILLLFFGSGQNLV